DLVEGIVMPVGDLAVTIVVVTAMLEGMGEAEEIVKVVHLDMAVHRTGMKPRLLMILALLESLEVAEEIAEMTDGEEARAVEEKRAAAEEKAAKAAAKAAAEEEERLRRLAEKEKEIAEANAKRDIAVSVVRGGNKGDALRSEIGGMERKPLASALVAEILSALEDPRNVKWPSPAEYGSALTLLLTGNEKEQMLSLYEMQKFYDTIGFPKIETKTGPKALWEVMFHLLYQHEVIDNSGFMAWWDDEDEERTEAPGRSTALIQATTFINWLQEADEDEEGEEEEDDDDSLEENPNR
ncbi:unnamed protein product, partial [Symbiodinium microadriaticum]